MRKLIDNSNNIEKNLVPIIEKKAEISPKRAEMLKKYGYVKPAGRH